MKKKKLKVAGYLGEERRHKSETCPDKHDKK